MSDTKISLGEQLTDTMTVTEQRAIKRCAQQISAVQIGDVPYCRDMGVNEILPTIDNPYARSEYEAAVELQLEEWETRATPSEISLGTDGVLKVVMDVNE